MSAVFLVDGGHAAIYHQPVAVRQWRTQELARRDGQERVSSRDAATGLTGSRS
jgi:hypothetical protein